MTLPEWVSGALEAGESVIVAAGHNLPQVPEFPLQPVTSRPAALSAAADLLIQAGVRPRHREPVEATVDELVGNALRVDEAPRLGVQVGMESIWVRVADLGTLSSACVREALLRAIRAGGAPRRDGDGAGLGLYLTLLRARTLVFELGSRGGTTISVELSRGPGGSLRALVIRPGRIG